MTTPPSWLDIVDEALCDLPEAAFSEEVAQAQSLIHDVLNGQVSPSALLAAPASPATWIPATPKWPKRPEEAVSAALPTFEQTYREVV
jgi:hypothetical protein